MSFSNYAGLQTAISTWGERTETTFVASIPDMIALAEAKLNRELAAIETDATLTGVGSSRNIDVSALSIDQPVALFANYYQNHETMLTPKAPGTYEQQNNAGKARYWSMDGTNIVLDRPLDGAYTFRFRYDQRFQLSVTPTNWLLTNFPDVYFAASLVWGATFNEDFPGAAAWGVVLQDGLASVRSSIAGNKRGDLTVDRALQGIGKRWRDNSWLNDVT